MQDGLKEINPEDDILQSPVFQRSEIDTPSRKRKAENEIADSQDEDDSEAEYQWDESLLDDGKEGQEGREEEQEQEKEKAEEGENDKTAE